MQHAHALGAKRRGAFVLAALGILCIPLAQAAVPTISGTPVTTTKVGVAYSFQPTARDADGNRLTFSIARRPPWATFSTSTGRLSGTPNEARAWSDIVISVTDGTSTRSLPAFTLLVRPGTNQPPTISGTPSTTAHVGTAWSFTPAAKDPEGATLKFSIANKPSWMTFSNTTGKLSGTPAASNVGTASSIRISVTDGTNTASLAAFTLTVSTASSTTSSVSLSWTPPTTNTDGTALMNLAGYRITYGTSASALNQTIQVSSAGITRYLVENLSPGVWYFGIKAYTSTGIESALSSVTSRTVN